MSGIVGREFIAGNVFVRQMMFDKAGDVVAGHAHNFDHITYCVRGGLRIEQLDVTGGIVRSVEKLAGEANWVLIRAGVEHRITALVDDSIGHCIYAHRTHQGDIVQEYSGWAPSYV